MSGWLRRLADWLDDPPLSASRMHSSQLDGLQHRKRDLLVLACGPVAVFIDLPKRFERPPVVQQPVSFTWKSLDGDL